MTKKLGERLSSEDDAINNYSAIRNPNQYDSKVQGYSIGSSWINVLALQKFVCLDDEIDNAVWKQITDQSGGVITANVFELDGNGDLMPSLSVESDNNFESDINGDIMPKGV